MFFIFWFLTWRFRQIFILSDGDKGVPAAVGRPVRRHHRAGTLKLFFCFFSFASIHSLFLLLLDNSFSRSELTIFKQVYTDLNLQEKFFFYTFFFLCTLFQFLLSRFVVVGPLWLICCDGFRPFRLVCVRIPSFCPSVVCSCWFWISFVVVVFCAVL